MSTPITTVYVDAADFYPGMHVVLIRDTRWTRLAALLKRLFVDGVLVEVAAILAGTRLWRWLRRNHAWKVTNVSTTTITVDGAMPPPAFGDRFLLTRQE